MPTDAHRRQLYEQCVREHAASLYRVAFRLTGCHESASELVQETFLNAWRDLNKLKDDSKMRSWMFAILRNQSGKLVRATRRGRIVPQPLVEEIFAPGMMGSQDVQAEVQEAIADLAEEHKLPLLFVAMEGLSVDEAAEILGLPRGTVLSRLHRGRQKLKAALARTLELEAAEAPEDRPPDWQRGSMNPQTES